jgi:hypothetical protein
MAAKCTLINHLNASPLSSLQTIEKKAKEEELFKQNYAPPHRKTSFCGRRKRRKNLEKQQTFPSGFSVVCFVRKHFGGREKKAKTDGKTFCGAYHIFFSSGRHQFPASTESIG